MKLFLDFVQSMPTLLYMKLSLILLWRNFSKVVGFLLN